MAQLQEGTIPMSPAEAEAFWGLMDSPAHAVVSITRRDPGEQGPVLVHTDLGTYEIGPDGEAVKQ